MLPSNFRQAAVEQKQGIVLVTYIPKDLEKPRWRRSKRKKIRRGKKISGSCLDFSEQPSGPCEPIELLGWWWVQRPTGCFVHSWELAAREIACWITLLRFPMFVFDDAHECLMWYDEGSIFVGKIGPIPLCTNFQHLTASPGRSKAKEVEVSKWVRGREVKDYTVGSKLY